MQFSVMSVPTVMLFVGGEMRERITGYQPLPRLIDKFEPHL
jgi:thioredoxin-like negative regulator of GroEL